VSVTWKYTSATQITGRSLQWPVQKQGSTKCISVVHNQINCLVAHWIFFLYIQVG